MTKREKLEEVKRQVEPIYKKLKCWPHGWLHIVKVVKSAKKLAQMEDTDPFLVQVAAYCHDLGRLEEERRGLVDPRPKTSLDHGEMSIEPTKKILAKIDVSGQGAEKILETIKIHPMRKYKGDNKIALILQDADRSDGFGKMALLRFAAFNCELPIKEPTNKKIFDREFSKMIKLLKIDKKARKRMIETLRYVAQWYEDLLNIDSAKKYLHKDYLFNINFLKQIESWD